MPREARLRGRIPDCRRSIAQLNTVRTLESIEDMVPLGRLEVRPGKIALSYKSNPRSLIGGRSETLFTIYKSLREFKAVGRGKLEVNLTIRCLGDDRGEIILEVAGEHEKLIPEEKLEYAVKRLAKTLNKLIGFEPEETAPTAPALQPPAQAAAPTATASSPTLRLPSPQPAAAAAVVAAAAPAPAPQPLQPATPAAALQQPLPPAPAAAAPQQPPGQAVLDERLRRLQCAARIVTAGFPLDEELSRRIPSEYSPRFRRGQLVDSGEGAPDQVNLIQYDDADYVIRVFTGDLKADIVRLASGAVGVYLKGPGGESYGEEALERLLDALCRPGARMLYWVVRV